MSFFLTFGLTLSAQQETIFNQFWNNQTYFSPAFAGFDYKHQAGAMYRLQWDNVNGAPIDGRIYYNTRIKDKFGVGIDASTVAIGELSSFTASVPFSYHLQLSEIADLSFGGALAFNRERNESFFIPPTSVSEPIIGNIDEDHLLAHLGVAYHRNKITAGAGVRNLTLTQLRGDDNFQFVPHYYGMFRYDLDFRGSLPYTTKFYLESIYGTDGVFQAFQVNGRMSWNSKASALLGYVWNNGILFGGGYDIAEKFRLMYSATWILSKLTSNTNFTHEFSFVYQLGRND